MNYHATITKCGLPTPLQAVPARPPNIQFHRGLETDSNGTLASDPSGTHNIQFQRDPLATRLRRGCLLLEINLNQIKRHFRAVLIEMLSL